MMMTTSNQMPSSGNNLPTPDARPGLPSPLETVADMRATAKWILAAAATVGAALLGGAPLAAVGKVHGVGDAALAYAGLAVALTGVGWAIWHTADALIPPLTTPNSLDQEPALNELRKKIAREPRAFFGPFGESMGELQELLDFHQKVARSLSDMLIAEQDPARRRVLRRKVDEANGAVTAIVRRSAVLLELAHAWQVRAQLRRARLHALAGAAVAALGAVIFLAATSSR
jgi:hypothetical protein